MSRQLTIASALFVVATAAAAWAHAGAFPPWSDPDDLPIPRWARSVAPHGREIPVFPTPDRGGPRRGTLEGASRPALFGAIRGKGCGGRFFEIGPAAWVCSDEAEMSPDDPPPLTARVDLPPPYADDGLAFSYAFVGPEGAAAFHDLSRAEDDTPDAELDPGFAVAIVEEQTAHGQRWAKTRRGLWVALHELNAVRPTTLRGEVLGAGEATTVSWVLAEQATTFDGPKAAKAVGLRARFDHVHRHEEQKGPRGLMVRISDEGAPPEWLPARQIATPTLAPPPAEAGGAAATARWIDVDLSTQTLLTYEGTRPVYAALISTGRGAQGTEAATPVGVYRVWVKLRTSTMSNLGDEEADTRYSIEDVPYVQFFAKGVALHGAFWHHAFGSPHSHGCVNLAPVDARWLFEFTGPRLPAGWSAVLPTSPIDLGTVVRVR